MMTFTTSRTTTSRTIAAAAAVAAASTLAACGSSDSQTSADAPSISSSTSATSAPSSSTSASSSSASASSSSTTTATPKATQTSERASRSQQRQALPTLSYVNWTQVEAVPSTTQYVYSADLPKGVSKVTQAGQAGTETVTYRSAKSGSKVVSTKTVDSKVTKAAVRRIVTIGTGATQQQAAPQQVSRSQVRRAVTQQAAPQRATTAATTTTASSAGAGGSSRAAYWNNVASCESTNNWHINTGNGFYGGLQFTQSTWAGFGGLAYAPRADLATPAQQMAIADKVMAVQGPGAWPVCHTRG